MGLLPDGRYLGAGRPWTARRPVPMPTYTRTDVLKAIRRCALALGRRPQSLCYLRWRRAVLSRPTADAYERQRLPNYGAILRFFATWRHALRAAAITDQELVDARTAWASPTAPSSDAGAHLAALAADAWERAGLSADERALVLERGPAVL
ncbi:MAG TPA: hypothetical protein VGF25_09625, partial [Thermoleophilaceae bacterium]